MDTKTPKPEMPEEIPEERERLPSTWKRRAASNRGASHVAEAAAG
jgi:hypothetical protein